MNWKLINKMKKFDKLLFLSSCRVCCRIREENSRWNLSRGRIHPWFLTRSLCMDKAIPDPRPCLCRLAMEGIPCRDSPNKGGLGPCSLRWAKVATSLVWVEWGAWATLVPTWWDPGWWVPTSPWGSSCNKDCRDSRYKSELTCCTRSVHTVKIIKWSVLTKANMHIKIT